MRPNELLLVLLVVCGLASFFWIGARNRRDTGQAQPLTFGSIVGAIVVGNLITALIAGILWSMLLQS